MWHIMWIETPYTTKDITARKGLRLSEAKSILSNLLFIQLELLLISENSSTRLGRTPWNQSVKLPTPLNLVTLLISLTALFPAVPRDIRLLAFIWT